MDKFKDKVVPNLIEDEDVKIIAIYGNTGSGKTSLAYYLLSLIGLDRQVFFYRYPTPEIIERMGYNNILSLERIEELEDSIIYIDEPQLHFDDIHNKKGNKILAKLCSLSRQLGITLIISTSDSRVFTKHNESYFDVWIVKNIDYKMVKQGSKIKEVIKKNSLFTPDSFHLRKGEFLFDCQKLEKFNGKYSFEMVPHFNEKLSKPYRKSNRAPNSAKKDEFAPSSLKKFPQQVSSKKDFLLNVQSIKDERD